MGEDEEKEEVKKRTTRARIARRLVSVAIDAGCLAAGIAFAASLHLAMFVSERLSDD